jgi:hypothetical protein
LFSSLFLFFFCCCGRSWPHQRARRRSNLCSTLKPVPSACATQPRPCLRTCSRLSRHVHARVFEPAAPMVSSKLCSTLKPVPSARATQRAHAFEAVLNPRSLCLLEARAFEPVLNPRSLCLLATTPVSSNLCSTLGACAFCPGNLTTPVSSN